MTGRLDGRRTALGAALCAAAAFALGAWTATAATIPAFLEEKLAMHVAAAPDAAGGPVDDMEVLGRFYAARGWAPLWTGEVAAAARGSVLAAFLVAVDREGLRPKDYGAARAVVLLGAVERERQAELELSLSRGLLTYARHQAEGRIQPRGRDFDVPLAMRQVDGTALMETAAVVADLPAWLAGLAPTGPRYARLVSLLAELRLVAAGEGWMAVPDVEPLKPGMVRQAVVPLRRRLVQTGDLPASALDLASGSAAALAATRYDAEIEAGVRRFQARHGLEPDGVAGKSTLAAMNRPVDWRIVQVLVALERLRLGVHDLGQRFVHINIPDYHLTYVDRASDPALPVRYESRVVVGTIKDQTPTFTGAMTFIELNPNWHVPRSIATKEFLPEIQKDPTYLERHNYVLSANGAAVDPWSVDWTTVTQGSFPYRIKQRPGSGNALGRVKFMFPNDYNVYIHDTPKKALFARGQRTFSHGCIRLADPFTFAELLLGRHGWDKTRFEEAVRVGRTRIVNLPDALPVFITYETAWVDDAGTVQFREDIYGRDAMLAGRLGRLAS